MNSNGSHHLIEMQPIAGNQVVPDVRTRTVLRCPMCDSEDTLRFFCAKDRLHGIPGEFAYSRCSKCNTVFQNPMVIDQDLPLCYPVNYYTHAITEDFSPNQTADLPQQDLQQMPLPRPGVTKKLRAKVKEAIMYEVYGKSLPGSWGIVGKILSRSSKLRVRAFNGNVKDEFILRTPDSPRALEVGCGNGWTLLELKSAGWQVEGVEWDSIAADAARRTTGTQIWEGDFRQLNLPLSVYGLIYMHHVFEHIDEPVQALRRIWELLSPRGRAVLIYPNPLALGARVYRSAWYPWDPPRHLVLPPASTVTKVAKEIGFVTVKSKTRDTFAAQCFANSRSYKSGRTLFGADANIEASDRQLEKLERAFLRLGINVGEEIFIVLEKTVNNNRK